MQAPSCKSPPLNTFVTQILYATQGSNALNGPPDTGKPGNALQDSLTTSSHRHNKIAGQSMVKVTAWLWHFSNLHSVEPVLVLQQYTKGICPYPKIQALPTFKYWRNSPKKLTEACCFQTFSSVFVNNSKDKHNFLLEVKSICLSCYTFHWYFCYSTVFCYCEHFLLYFLHTAKSYLLGSCNVCQNSMVPLTQHHYPYLSINEKSSLLVGSHSSLSLKLYLAVIKNFCAALKKNAVGQ